MGTTLRSALSLMRDFLTVFVGINFEVGMLKAAGCLPLSGALLCMALLATPNSPTSRETVH